MKFLLRKIFIWLHNRYMNFLSEQERKQLKIQHKQERDKRVCDRIKAILLYDEGWTPQQIAKVLLISDQAVRNHVSDYQTIPKKTQKFARIEKKQDRKRYAGCAG